VYVDYGDAKIKDTLLAVGYENNNISFLAFNPSGLIPRSFASKKKDVTLLL
jgi:hypothetical protein